MHRQTGGSLQLRYFSFGVEVFSTLSITFDGGQVCMLYTGSQSACAYIDETYRDIDIYVLGEISGRVLDIYGYTHIQRQAQQATSMLHLNQIYYSACSPVRSFSTYLSILCLCMFVNTADWRSFSIASISPRIYIYIYTRVKCLMFGALDQLASLSRKDMERPRYLIKVKRRENRHERTSRV